MPSSEGEPTLERRRIEHDLPPVPTQAGEAETTLGNAALVEALSKVAPRYAELGGELSRVEQETPPHTPEIASAELPPHSLAAAAIHRAIEVHGSSGEALKPTLAILRLKYPEFFPK